MAEALSPIVRDALEKHLGQQQMIVIEVRELLTILAEYEQGAIAGPMSLAARALSDVSRALDCISLAAIIGPSQPAEERPERLDA